LSEGVGIDDDDGDGYGVTCKTTDCRTGRGRESVRETDEAG
jgi:hypothetical protein